MLLHVLFNLSLISPFTLVAASRISGPLRHGFSQGRYRRPYVNRYLLRTSRPYPRPNQDIPHPSSSIYAYRMGFRRRARGCPTHVRKNSLPMQRDGHGGWATHTKAVTRQSDLDVIASKRPALHSLSLSLSRLFPSRFPVRLHVPPAEII